MLQQQYKWAGLQLLAGSRPHKALKGLKGVKKGGKAFGPASNASAQARRRPLVLTALQAGQCSCQVASCRQRHQAWCRQPGPMLHAVWLIQRVTGEETPSAWHSAAAYIDNGTVQSWLASHR